jgi:penicillin-binding protein 2
VLANSGKLFQPHVVQRVLSPGTPDSTPGFADLEFGTVTERFDQLEPVRVLDMTGDRRDPIVNGLTRVITGPGVTFGYYHKTTGENLFRGYPYKTLPIAGKTGTAQGFGNLPWNDSSAFGAFSLDSSMPYTAYAYLEKSGYGSQAAAPVIKCLFTALAGEYRLDPVVPADPLNLSSAVAAPPSTLRNPVCLAGVGSDSRD